MTVGEGKVVVGMAPDLAKALPSALAEKMCEVLVEKDFQEGVLRWVKD